MICHIVLFRPAPLADAAAIDRLVESIRGLRSEIRGIVSVAAGKDTFPDARNQGYTQGLIVTFDGPTSRDAYLDARTHRELAASFYGLVAGGRDGTLVFDLAS